MKYLRKYSGINGFVENYMKDYTPEALRVWQQMVKNCDREADTARAGFAELRTIIQGILRNPNIVEDLKLYFEKPIKTQETEIVLNNTYIETIKNNNAINNKEDLDFVIEKLHILVSRFTTFLFVWNQAWINAKDIIVKLESKKSGDGLKYLNKLYVAGMYYSENGYKLNI